MITKLMEWVGVSPEIKVQSVSKAEIYPELTPEKAWKLEEMIILKKGRFNYSFDCEVHRYGIFLFALGTWISSGKTRFEALASLITQIDWSEQEMEQIKGILEG